MQDVDVLATLFTTTTSRYDADDDDEADDDNFTCAVLFAHS